MRKLEEKKRILLKCSRILGNFVISSYIMFHILPMGILSTFMAVAKQDATYNNEYR